MNEQKNDSLVKEAGSPTSEVSETASQKPKEHTGILDNFAALWHKKTPEISKNISEPATIVSTQETSPTPDAPLNPTQNTSIAQTHTHLADKIAKIFHKKSQEKALEISPIAGMSEVLDSPAAIQENPATPFVMDEKFARLLKQDTTYHSMIRSEDIKNIQLQLSMRYMLLMLAIFVVIAWVVNNRVIMFGFSDFPLLARTRDVLFALLTGLFSLTVWFGSRVWFHHKVGVILLQILAVILFVVVMVSIYLPFWR